MSRAEGHLLEAQRLLKQSREEDASSALSEVYALLPHQETPPPVPTARHLSQKLDLCQVTVTHTHTDVDIEMHARTRTHTHTHAMTEFRAEPGSVLNGGSLGFCS